MINANKKSAYGTHRNADSINTSRLHFKPLNKKIKPTFPPKASPLFCSFDIRIADHINKVGSYSYFMQHENYYLYDLIIFSGKEVWIFYLSESHRALSIKFAYALLRHGAIMTKVHFFPLEGGNYVG